MYLEDYLYDLYLNNLRIAFLILINYILGGFCAENQRQLSWIIALRVQFINSVRDVCDESQVKSLS
jgi:hypothetical protein